MGTAPVFTFCRIEDDPRSFPHSNRNVHEMRNAETWKPDCDQAFDEVVARARRNFDIAW